MLPEEIILLAAKGIFLLLLKSIIRHQRLVVFVEAACLATGAQAVNSTVNIGTILGSTIVSACSALLKCCALFCSD